MESLLLSDKNDYNIDYIKQNLDDFFDTIDNILSKTKDDKNISKLCTKLVNIYKDKDFNLVINCIPYLIKYYFYYYYNEKICPIIEACILTIYNLSLNDETSRCNRIRVPNLSTPSVYHNPQTSATQSELTESALFKLECEHVILTDHYKPFNIQNVLNNEKKIGIIKYLLVFYYSKLSLLTKQSKLAYIDMCVKACRPNRPAVASQHGIYHQSHHHQHHHHEKMQFYVTSQIFVEFVYGLHYLFYNGFSREAFKAIDIISQKADDELMCDVILICNSIKNSIQLANSDMNDLNGSKNTLINASPLITSAKRHSVGNGSTSINTTYTCQEGTADSNLNKNNNIELNIDDEDDDDDDRKSNILEHSLARVYIAPSAEEREAVRRASMKLRNSKIFHQQQQQQEQQQQQQQQEDNEKIENKKDDSNGFTNLDNIPIIDDSNGESVANDDDDDDDDDDVVIGKTNETIDSNKQQYYRNGVSY